MQVLLPMAEDHNAAQEAVSKGSLLAFPMSRKGINPLRELQTIWATFLLYRGQSPELVHHFTIKPVIYGTLAAWAAGVPKIVNSITGLGYVFTSNSLQAKILGFIVKNLYRLCFASSRVRIIFQNADDRDFFIEHGILPIERCFLVQGSGVDVHKFKPSIAAVSEAPRIFIATRLLQEKGIFEFMEALQILKRKGLEFVATVAGDIDLGNPGSASAAQVEIWKQSGLAEFLGFQKDMVSLLAKTDIACLPSYREGLPMALLEAMAAGKPIVTTEAPGCRAVVVEGTNGFKVPIKNSQALADALEQLIRDPSLRAAMGAESRKMAVELFSMEKITTEIAKVYESF